MAVAYKDLLHSEVSPLQLRLTATVFVILRADNRAITRRQRKENGLARSERPGGLARRDASIFASFRLASCATLAHHRFVRCQEPRRQPSRRGPRLVIHHGAVEDGARAEKFGLFHQEK